MFVMCGSQALVLPGSAACFTLGLLAKAMLVTLPFLLLLLDYWPLRRFAVVAETAVDAPGCARPLPCAG